MGWIYKITCKPTSKVYVGQTINACKTRWTRHKSESQMKDTHLARSARKYGWSSFKFEAVRECPDDELDNWERHYIAKWDSFRNGLNMTPGGQDVSCMLVPEIKEKRMATMRIPEVKKKWLSAITKAQQRPEQKKLLSDLCRERCKDPLHMEKRARGQEKYLDSLDDDARINVIARMQTKDAKAKRVKNLKATLATEAGKANKSSATKESWKDPESRKRRIEGLKAAAEKRRKLKAANVPYDNERRAAAMRAGWLKRKGLSAERTIPRLEECRDAPVQQEHSIQ